MIIKVIFDEGDEDIAKDIHKFQKFHKAMYDIDCNDIHIS